MKSSLRLLSSEFNTKSHSSVWQPRTGYGRAYMAWGMARKNWMTSLNWVTRDSNRLTNYAQRYQHVIDELDLKRNEEELQIPLADVRWHDHRKLHFQCKCCGDSYQQHVSSKVKFRAGCRRCHRRFPSRIRQYESMRSAQPLESAYPELCDQLLDGEGVRQFPTTSAFPAKWKCKKCQATYTATIRSRTGEVFPGEPPLANDTAWYDSCPSCVWGENITPVGKQILREGSFLGLEPEFTSGKKVSMVVG